MKVRGPFDNFRTIACTGKVAFETRRHANMAADRKRGRNAYKCPACGKYHVGHHLAKRPARSPSQREEERLFALPPQQLAAVACSLGLE